MILYREESLSFHGELAKSVILVLPLLVGETLYDHFIFAMHKPQNHRRLERSQPFEEECIWNVGRYMHMVNESQAKYEIRLPALVKCLSFTATPA